MAGAKTKGLHFFDPRRNLMDRAGCLAEVPPGRRGTIHQVVEAPAQQTMKVDAPAVSTDQRAPRRVGHFLDTSEGASAIKPLIPLNYSAARTRLLILRLQVPRAFHVRSQRIRLSLLDSARFPVALARGVGQLQPLLPWHSD